MPALSKQQQKLFGLALSVKRGDTPRSEVSKDIIKIVDTMSEKDIEKFAETEHKGLPKKVEQKIREMARQTIRERMMEESVNEDKISQPIQNLIDDMVKNKIQRRSVTIKSKSGHARFMKDVKPALKDKLLIIKHNPIDKDEMFISLGPKALKKTFNEASGEFVTYIEKDNGRKKLLRTSKSQRAANMFMKKHMDSILNKSGIRSIGSMSKDQWEKKEAPFAENIKKKDMKTVTKKEWDRTHKDFKGMIKGQPYMMWYDKKTHGTVYGPVHIKESVNEARFDRNKLMRIMKKYDDAMIQTSDGDEFLIYSPYSNNKDNADMWHRNSVTVLDKDATEHEIDYKDIVKIKG